MYSFYASRIRELKRKLFERQVRNNEKYILNWLDLAETPLITACAILNSLFQGLRYCLLPGVVILVGDDTQVNTYPFPQRVTV